MDFIEKARVLLAGDKDCLIIADLLNEAKGISCRVDHVTTYDAAVKAIENDNHDVCLFDYRLDQHNGFKFMKVAFDSKCNPPIILLAEKEDHDFWVRAVKAGAADFLGFDQINTLLLERAIRYAVRHKQTERQLLNMVYYDDLTGLPNRILFKDRLSVALANARRHQRILGVLVFDLDNFKRINDSLGYGSGDLLVRKVAERLSTCLRKSDSFAFQTTDVNQTTIARQGSDEFNLLLTEFNDIPDAARVAQRILQSFSLPFILGKNEVFITASLGIATFPQDGEDADSLLRNADTAMYYAKNRGKNNFQFYKKEMNATALQRLSLETDLRKAMDQEKFMIYFQPVIDLKSGKIVGAESLLRWQHSERGFISPADFIPLAEETGLIVPIGEWVLKTACVQNKAWQNAGFTPIRIAVNLSSHQFKKRNLFKIVCQALDYSGLDPRYLELEITESVMMQDVESTIAILQEFNAMGIRLSLDDFGTGYSSLSYLKRFPLNTLKIDRSFIKEVTTDPDDASITKTIISMARNLNLKVIAEGVEDEQQLELLYRHECDEIQGFLFSRPVPGQEFSVILDKESKGEGIGIELCQKVMARFSKTNARKKDKRSSVPSSSVALQSVAV